MRSPLLTLVLAGTAGLAACAQPEPAVSDVPLPELAATAEPMGDPAAPTAGVQGDAAASPATGGATPEQRPRASVTQTAAPSAPPAPAPSTSAAAARDDAAASPRRLAAAEDGRGDAGLEGPDWADLTGLRLVDTGPDLAVTVTLAAAPPARLQEGEVVGIGVDLYAPGAGASSSQLFVDGGSDGWRAYLETSDGFVAYPGELRIEGRRVSLSVPWPAVGDPSESEVTAFLDWSRGAVVTNLVARDDAPDRGRLRFTR